MSHIWMSHVTHMNESCHTYEYESCHTCQQEHLLFLLISLSSPTAFFSRHTRIIQVHLYSMRDMTPHRRDSFMCVTCLSALYKCVWLIHIFKTHVRHDSFVCTTWLIYMCDMTHSSVWHDSFICVTWLIHLCDMTHSYARHDWFICKTCLIRMCYVSPRKIQVRVIQCGSPHISMSHIAHVNESRHTCQQELSFFTHE